MLGPMGRWMTGEKKKTNTGTELRRRFKKFLEHRKWMGGIWYKLLKGPSSFLWGETHSH